MSECMSRYKVECEVNGRRIRYTIEAHSMEVANGVLCFYTMQAHCREIVAVIKDWTIAYKGEKELNVNE